MEFRFSSLLQSRASLSHINGHPFGRSGGVSTSARVDPGLVRAELGQLLDTRWLGLSSSRNACSYG